MERLSLNDFLRFCRSWRAINSVRLSPSTIVEHTWSPIFTRYYVHEQVDWCTWSNWGGLPLFQARDCTLSKKTIYLSIWVISAALLKYGQFSLISLEKVKNVFIKAKNWQQYYCKKNLFTSYIYFFYILYYIHQSKVKQYCLLMKDKTRQASARSY